MTRELTPSKSMDWQLRSVRSSVLVAVKPARPYLVGCFRMHLHAEKARFDIYMRKQNVFQVWPLPKRETKPKTAPFQSFYSESYKFKWVCQVIHSPPSFSYFLHPMHAAVHMGRQYAYFVRPCSTLLDLARPLLDLCSTSARPCSTLLDLCSTLLDLSSTLVLPLSSCVRKPLVLDFTWGCSVSPDAIFPKSLQCRVEKRIKIYPLQA